MKYYLKLMHISPSLPKFALWPLCFYKRPTLVPVFVNWKKSRGFSLLQKKKIKLKSKTSVSISFAATFSISALSRHTFQLVLWASVLYLHLFCASFCKIHPEVNVSPVYTKWAYERFHRSILLADRGEVCASTM